MEPLIGTAVNPEGLNIYKQAGEPFFTLDMVLQEASPEILMQHYTYGDLKADFRHFDLEHFMLFENTEEVKVDPKKGKDSKEPKIIFAYDEDTVLN
jgi:hypothetical protein